MPVTHGVAGSSPVRTAEKKKLINLMGFFRLMPYHQLMEHVVYAISSLTRNYIYVGMTSNLSDRLSRHNKGYEKTTRPYSPFEIIYQEKCENRQKARLLEKYWKSGIGKERLRKIRDEKAGLSTDS